MKMRALFFQIYRIGCFAFIGLGPLMGLALFANGQLTRADATLTFLIVPGASAAFLAASFLFEQPGRKRD